MKKEEIEGLFYELASESRFSILQELKIKAWKMNDLALKLDLTTTETFRQLQRLTDAALTKKQADGGYTITEYGKLVLQITLPLNFLHKNKEYFLTHDISLLPNQFIMRLDELSGASMLLGMVESTTRISTMIGEGRNICGVFHLSHLCNNWRLSQRRCPWVANIVSYRPIYPKS